MGELEGGFEVLRALILVGVDEDEVEGAAIVGDKSRKGVEGRALAEGDEISEAGAFKVHLGDLGIVGIELEREEDSVGREGTGEPDRAVAAEGANLEDGAGALQAREEEEEPALRRCNRDIGKSGLGSSGAHCFQHGVRGQELLVEIAIDRLPIFLTHAGGSVGERAPQFNLPDHRAGRDPA